MDKEEIVFRKSFMLLENPYFFTASILKWQKLLKQDKYKQIIIDSLQFLVKKGKIRVYGFVIMPNHIHLIWELKENNGREKPSQSFLKFTAHEFRKDLLKNHPQVIPYFEINNQSDRELQFWQTDSLAICLNSREICEQKLDYIHLNPLQEHWNLAQYPEDYIWSSAKFYETGADDFGFLTHYMDRF
jgi:REP element-mobilizing transposase RayT